MPAGPIVELAGVSKRFGAVTAVDAVSFAVQPGEFFSLLGPSGCGKTTTLRLLAGFETADAGEIRMAGKSVNDRRPYERPIAMVFQSYALFPHLNVERNVSFGLEQRHRPAAEIRRRVGQVLERVRLDPGIFARRRPSELSGGQRQRVALARALVLDPATLLLDEPLGALDLQLRKEMQRELKALNRELRTTFIYVTHDQEEALTMSDRIAVMDGGRIAQVGTPAEVYERPRTAFVAAFIGTSNLFCGTAGRHDGTAGRREVSGPAGTFLVPDDDRTAAGAAVTIAVRPEWLSLAPPDAATVGCNALPGTVTDIIYLGDSLQVVVGVAGIGDVTVAVRSEGRLDIPIPWRAADRVLVTWRPDDCQILEE